jgi:hypothetical protein
VEIELGGVQVCVEYDLILVSSDSLYLTLIHLHCCSCAVVVAQLVALVVAGTVHRVCITTWYVTFNTLLHIALRLSRGLVPTF